MCDLVTGPGAGVGPGVPGEPSIEDELEEAGVVIVIIVVLILMMMIVQMICHLVVPVVGSPLELPGLFWFLSFSSLRHLARRLENQT